MKSKSNLSFCTFVLLFISGYALCSCSLLLNKEADLLKKQNNHVGAAAGEQRILPTVAVGTISKEELRQKRSELDFSANEYADYLDDLDGNSIPAQFENEIINMPSDNYKWLLSYFQCWSQIQDPSVCRTKNLRPRPGRSVLDGKYFNSLHTFPYGIDLRHLPSAFGRGIDIGDDGNGVTDKMRQQKEFLPHLIKKSVPFKPRLGKRTQQAMLCE